MPRFYVQWKTTCTWSTDVEGDSEEAVREMVSSPSETWLPSDCELITEEDVRDYLVVEMIDDSDFDPYNPIRHGNPNLDDSDPPRWEL